MRHRQSPWPTGGISRKLVFSLPTSGHGAWLTGPRRGAYLAVVQAGQWHRDLGGLRHMSLVDSPMTLTSLSTPRGRLLGGEWKCGGWAVFSSGSGSEGWWELRVGWPKAPLWPPDKGGAGQGAWGPCNWVNSGLSPWFPLP